LGAKIGKDCRVVQAIGVSPLFEVPFKNGPGTGGFLVFANLTIEEGNPNSFRRWLNKERTFVDG